MSAVKKIDAEEVKAQKRALWNKKILVVDDEREILSIYKDILSPTEQKTKIQSSRAGHIARANASNVVSFEKKKGLENASAQDKFQINAVHPFS